MEAIDRLASLSLTDANYLACLGGISEEAYIDEFAHGNCYLIAETLLLLAGLNPKLNLNVLVIYEYGVDHHYLNTISLEGHIFYLDAYGLYQSTEPIFKRYSITPEQASIQLISLKDYITGANAAATDLHSVVMRQYSISDYNRSQITQAVKVLLGNLAKHIDLETTS